MRVIIAAGGTGGHLFPALAVAEALHAEGKETEITFIGVGTELEKKLLGKTPFRHHVVPFTGLVGKGIKGVGAVMFQLPRAFFKVMKLYLQHRPDLVIGFGGYPSVVPVCVAKCLFIPVFIHEQNVQIGVANKMLSLFSKKTFAVHGAQGFWGRNVEHLDNPVRAVFREVSPWRSPKAGEPFCLLVFGGSQGARSLNSAMVELAELFSQLSIRVIHQTGRNDFSRVKEGYARGSNLSVEVVEFIDDMKSAYEQAHLVVCRAGAMSVSELSAVRRPVIFVPLAIALGHQAKNAEHLVQRKRALIVLDNQELGKRLGEILVDFVRHPEKLEAMVAQDAGKNSTTFSADIIAKSARLIIE